MIRNQFVSAEEIAACHHACDRLYCGLTGKAPSFLIESYGCQMNDVDAKTLCGLLEKCGFRRAKGKDDADLIIFNTCCVRDHAEKRVLGNVGALKKLKDEKPGLLIAVCGCMMQQRETAEKLFKRFPFVNLIFGTNEMHRFPLLLERALSGERVLAVRDSEGEIAEGLPSLREKAFSSDVIIMYGCDNFCTYCVVPYVRGRERSRKPDDIVAEVQSLAEAGCIEVTLLGQNVNSYRATDCDLNFPALLKRINDETGIARIRFMTSHPKDLSDELIAAMATLSKVCNHIHLPMQSGSNRILRLMNRGYTREDYLALTDKLKAHVPGIEITTDIIVGFPDEREEDFQDTMDMMARVGFSSAYTFMYSPRAGTKAASMENQVPEDVKKKRLAALNQLHESLLKTQNQRYIGMRGEVLVEGFTDKIKPTAFGKLPNFKMVYFDGTASMIGAKVPVLITGTESNSLVGQAQI